MCLTGCLLVLLSLPVSLHSYKKVPLRDCPSHLRFCCGLKVFPVSWAGAIIARIGVDGLWEWDLWKGAWFRWGPEWPGWLSKKGTP